MKKDLDDSDDLLLMSNSHSCDSVSRFHALKASFQTNNFANNTPETPQNIPQAIKKPTGLPVQSTEFHQVATLHGLSHTLRALQGDQALLQRQL